MIKRLWRENRFLLKPFLVILLIYFVGILAIILAGVHFADDVGRTDEGYSGWAGFSRYISMFLSYGIHADWYLTNVAPWPQILAIVILSVSSVLLIVVVAGREALKEKWTKWIWLAVAVVPLGLSPYMLECLSYQYDAPYMALSVLFAVMPMMFWGKKKWLFGVMVAIGTFGVCMTYQAAIGIILMLIVFAGIKEWNQSKTKSKDIIKKVLIAFGVFIISLFVFQKILMRPRDGYVSNSLPEIGQFFPLMWGHLRQYFEFVVSDFRTLWKILIVVTMVMFIVIFAMRSQKKKILAVVVAIMGGLAMMVSIYIMYSILEKPLYEPRAMYAIGGFIAIIGVYVVDGKYSAFVAKAPVAVLGYCFVIFALTYGNALKEQNDFRNDQVRMVVADLNELELMRTEGMKSIRVDGQIGLAPSILNMPTERYRILRRLLRPSFSRDIPWMALGITQRAGFNNLTSYLNEGLDKERLPLLKHTYFYKIYGDESGIIVEFVGDYDILRF